MRTTGAAVQGAVMVSAQVGVRMNIGEALDGLRGLSAATVVLSHAVVFSLDNQTTAFSLFLGWSARAAVIFFFVLSGHVITLSIQAMQERDGFSLRRFVINRFARIYPPFLLSIALVWIIALCAQAGWLVSPKGFNQDSLAVSAWSFLRDITFMFGNGTPAQMINGPIWSLRIEIVCYAIAALLALAWWRPWPMRLLALTLAVCLAGAALFRLESAWLGFAAFAFGSGATLRPLLAQGLAAYPLWLLALSTGAAGFYFSGAAQGINAPEHAGYAAFQLMLILACTSAPVVPLTGLSWVQKVGIRFQKLERGSYTLFITHYPLMIISGLLLPSWPAVPLQIFWLLIAVYGFAFLAATLVERQALFRQWLNRIVPGAETADRFRS